MDAPLSRREPTRARPPAASPVLWAALLGGPLACLALLEIDYILVTWACAEESRWPLHLAAAVAVLLAAAAAFAGWRARGKDARDGDPRHPAPAARAHFLGRIAALSGALSVLVALALWLPILVLDPCQRA
jgi:hypothetical protein